MFHRDARVAGTRCLARQKVRQRPGLPEKKGEEKKRAGPDPRYVPAGWWQKQRIREERRKGKKETAIAPELSDHENSQERVPSTPPPHRFYPLGRLEHVLKSSGARPARRDRKFWYHPKENRNLACGTSIRRPGRGSHTLCEHEHVCGRHSKRNPNTWPSQKIKGREGYEHCLERGESPSCLY